MENLGTIVLAVGALGTAAFGVVEAFKWTRIGLMGFGQIEKLLGSPAMAALEVAYGPQYPELLKAQYRTGRTDTQMLKIIRQGVRIGLTPNTAKQMAERMSVVDADAIVAVAESLQAGRPLTEEQRGVLGRFELALDARIDAAVAMANDRYIGSLRVVASLVAIAIAVAVGISADQDLFLSLIVGIAAIPVAPVAKDLTKAIQAAGKALPAKR